LAGRKFGEFTRFEHLVKKVWQMNRFSQMVIIVSRNFDGISLTNHGLFVKFAKLSRYTVRYNTPYEIASAMYRYAYT